jgi:hypothetical protein
MTLVIIACRVLECLLVPHLRKGAISAIFMDYGLHRTPEKMQAALQEKITRLAAPSVIVLGYGLCGNGLVGVKAGVHKLIVPRADDCITLLLGSYQRYIEEFSAEPGTYYLSKGWLESGSHPLGEYRALLEKHQKEDADWVIDEQYRNYKRLVLVAPNEAELDACRHQASQVADFCAARWGYRYEERIGCDGFVRRLITEAPQLHESTEDFLVVPPGGQIKQEMFWREKAEGQQ